MRWLAIAGLVAAAVAATVYIMSRPPAPPEPARETRVTGETVVVELRHVPKTVEASGLVTSVREAVLAGKALAAVSAIRVREGDRVRAGEPVVVLDDRELRADLERAQADRDHASSQLARLTTLAEEGLVSPQALDDARRTAKVAEAVRASADAQLAASIIRAPFDAVVTERFVEVGDMATPGRPLFHLEDANALRLEVALPGEEAAFVRTGQTVDVTVETISLRGTVALVVPKAESGTHSVTVKITLPRSPGLKTGLYGRARVAVGNEPALVIPASAVASIGALDRVYVIDAEGTVRARLVRVGRPIGGGVEVRSGLEPGERVLIEADRGVDGGRYADAPP
ncbi:MAG: efflux RND transporter periplasmic adaptor subunit [Nitrospiria bacterium]